MENQTNPTYNQNEEQPQNEPVHPEQGADVEPNPDPGPGEAYVGEEQEPEVTVNENAQQEDSYQEPAHIEQGADVKQKPESDPATGEAYVSDEQEPEVTVNDTTQPEESFIEPAHADEGADVEPNPDPGPGEAYVGKDGNVTLNPHAETEEVTTTEAQPSTDKLAETGSGDLGALGVAGTAALVLGAGATALKRRKNRRPQ